MTRAVTEQQRAPAATNAAKKNMTAYPDYAMIMVTMDNIIHNNNGSRCRRLIPETRLQ